MSTVDAEDRVGAVRSLTNFPILIVAATKTSTALADWRAQTKLQFFAAVLAVIVVICTIFPIVRQLRRQQPPRNASCRRRASTSTPPSTT